MKRQVAVRRVWLSYLVVIAGFVINGQAAFAGSVMPKVLVTNAPLKPIAEAIVAGIGSVSVLTSPNQDAHSMTISPSQARALEEAEIILMPDRDMNPVVKKLAEAREKQGAKLIVLTEMPEAKVLPYPTDNPWMDMQIDDSPSDSAQKLIDRARESAEAKEEKTEAVDAKKDVPADDAKAPPHDPHVWMDPVRMAALTPAIAEAIATVAPSQRAGLMANAKLLQRHLNDELTPLLRSVISRQRETSRFQSRPTLPYITSHRAYQYFFRRFGLKDYGALFMRPEDYIGAQTTKTALAHADKLAIQCVVAETPGGLVKKVAQASGARVVNLSADYFVPFGTLPALPALRNDYDKLLYVTAREFSACL